MAWLSPPSTELVGGGLLFALVSGTSVQLVDLNRAASVIETKSMPLQPPSRSTVIVVLWKVILPLASLFTTEQRHTLEEIPLGPS